MYQSAGGLLVGGRSCRCNSDTSKGRNDSICWYGHVISNHTAVLDNHTRSQDNGCSNPAVTPHRGGLQVTVFANNGMRSNHDGNMLIHIRTISSLLPSILLTKMSWQDSWLNCSASSYVTITPRPYPPGWRPRSVAP
jgi:hypothetical protein